MDVPCESYLPAAIDHAAKVAADLTFDSGLGCAVKVANAGGDAGLSNAEILELADDRMKRNSGEEN